MARKGNNRITIERVFQVDHRSQTYKDFDIVISARSKWHRSKCLCNGYISTCCMTSYRFTPSQAVDMSKEKDWSMNLGIFIHGSS